MKVGDTLAGYEIVAKLSSGGMASVFLGRRGGAGGFAKHVAIKVVHPHLAEDPSFVEMFLDEARLSARIEHPAVVHVHDLGEADGAYFMVMEYIAGCSLAQLLKVLGKKQLRLAPEVAVSIAMKVASGLHAAHDLTNDQGQNLGVVHRDVSPHNVLLAFKGHVKLIDFGIAKAAERSQQTQGSLLKGKIRYMAPEQAFGKHVDRRTDVYALGILLYEMLTSHRLFDGDSDLQILEQVRDPRVRPPGTIVSGITPQLDAIVMSALSKQPELRPDTADVLRQKLATAMPQALAVDHGQVADLLGVLMSDVIAAEHKKLGNVSQISMILGVPTTSANAHSVVERLAVPLAPRHNQPAPTYRPSLASPAAAATMPAAAPLPPPRRVGVPAAPPPPSSASASSAHAAFAATLAPGAHDAASLGLGPSLGAPPPGAAPAMRFEPPPDATPSHVREAPPPRPLGGGLTPASITPQPVPIPPGAPVPTSPSPYLQPLTAPEPPKTRSVAVPIAIVLVVLLLLGAAGAGAYVLRPWERFATSAPVAEGGPVIAVPPAQPAPIDPTQVAAPAAEAPAIDPAQVAAQETAPDVAAPEVAAPEAAEVAAPAPEAAPIVAEHEPARPAAAAASRDDDARTEPSPATRRGRRGARRGGGGSSSQIVDGVPLTDDVEF